MVDVVVTRKFRLDNLNISEDLLIFRDLVNKQIMQGLQLPYDVFDNKSLISVKRFYTQVNNCSCGLRERVHRCGAQYSYFAVREYRRNQENFIEIIDILIKNGFFRDNSKEILEKTDLSVFEIGNKIAFIRNQMLNEFDHIDLNKFYNDSIELAK